MSEFPIGSAQRQRCRSKRGGASDHRRPACDGKRASGPRRAEGAMRLWAGGTPACHDRRDACLPPALQPRRIRC